MPNDQQLNAKTKMVTDYLMLAQSLHQAADSMNAYVAVLASTSTHSDTVSLLIPPPQLPPLAPYNGPGGARIPLPNLHNRAANNHSDSEEEGDNSKKRKSRATKEKKPKDPNAPKRPASGYLVYQNDVRAQVKAANPNMPHKDVQAKIAADWATLDADEKKAYNDKAAAALADWKDRTAEYAKTKGDEPVEAKPKPASKAAKLDATPVLPNVEASSEADETGEDESEEETAAAVVPQAGRKKAAAQTSEEEESEDEEEAPPAKKSKKAASPPKSSAKKADKEKAKSAEKKKKNKA